MKGFLSVLTVILMLSSCRGAYETLSTPFKHVGRGLGYIGSTVAPTNREEGSIQRDLSSTVGAFEIAVKAPPGSVINTAVDLFHKEARKVCGGPNYKHKVTHKGSAAHTEISRTNMTSPRVPTTQMVPHVKGIVVCNDALEESV